MEQEHVKIIFPILFFPISVSFDIFFLPSKALFHLTAKATHSLVFSWTSDRLQVGFRLAAVCLCQCLVCLCLCSLVRVMEIVTLALPKIVMKMKLAYMKCFAQCPAQGLPNRYAEMTVSAERWSGRPGIQLASLAQDLHCIALKENLNLTPEALDKNLFFRTAFLNCGSCEPQSSKWLSDSLLPRMLRNRILLDAPELADSAGLDWGHWGVGLSLHPPSRKAALVLLEDLGQGSA